MIPPFVFGRREDSDMIPPCNESIVQVIELEFDDPFVLDWREDSNMIPPFVFGRWEDSNMIPPTLVTIANDSVTMVWRPMQAMRERVEPFCYEKC